MKKLLLQLHIENIQHVITVGILLLLLVGLVTANTLLFYSQDIRQQASAGSCPDGTMAPDGDLSLCTKKSTPVATATQKSTTQPQATSPAGQPATEPKTQPTSTTQSNPTSTLKPPPQPTNQSSPECSPNGKTQCSGTSKLVCLNGAWELVVDNSSCLLAQTPPQAPSKTSSTSQAKPSPIPSPAINNNTQGGVNNQSNTASNVGGSRPTDSGNCVSAGGCWVDGSKYCVQNGEVNSGYCCNSGRFQSGACGQSTVQDTRPKGSDACYSSGGCWIGGSQFCVQNNETNSGYCCSNSLFKQGACTSSQTNTIPTPSPSTSPKPSIIPKPQIIPTPTATPTPECSPNGTSACIGTLKYMCILGFFERATSNIGCEVASPIPTPKTTSPTPSTQPFSSPTPSPIPAAKNCVDKGFQCVSSQLCQAEGVKVSDTSCLGGNVCCSFSTSPTPIATPKLTSLPVSPTSECTKGYTTCIGRQKFTCVDGEYMPHVDPGECASLPSPNSSPSGVSSPIPSPSIKPSSCLGVCIPNVENVACADLGPKNSCAAGYSCCLSNQIKPPVTSNDQGFLQTQYSSSYMPDCITACQDDPNGKTACLADKPSLAAVGCGPASTATIYEIVTGNTVNYESYTQTNYVNTSCGTTTVLENTNVMKQNLNGYATVSDTPLFNYNVSSPATTQDIQEMKDVVSQGNILFVRANVCGTAHFVTVSGVENNQLVGYDSYYNPDCTTNTGTPTQVNFDTYNNINYLTATVVTPNGVQAYQTGDTAHGN